MNIGQSSWGYQHWSARVRYGATDAFLKIYREPLWWENECSAIDLLASRQVGPLMVWASGRLRHRRFLAMPYIHATSLSEEHFHQLSWLVNTLSAVYHIQGPRYGLLVDVLKGGGTGTWKEFLQTRMNERIGWLRHHSVPKELHALSTGLQRALNSGPFDCLPTLIHKDLKPQNIGITTAREPVVFDWEFATFGDPLYDIAFLGWRSGAPSLDPFLSLYSATVGNPVAEPVARFRMRFYRLYLAFGAYAICHSTPRKRLGDLDKRAWVEVERADINALFEDWS